MTRGLLAAVLLLAAALRFYALDWGLRHQPHWDERVFTDRAVLMVSQRSLDHRFYEYPGLFFYLLYPVLLPLGLRPPAGPDAVFALRATVAGFGVISVGLAYWLGRRLSGPALGLVAALLLAVSPLDVWTAHMVRPDVVLGSFVLLALLALCRVGERAKDDLLAGAAIGAATAVKFTGVLLWPSYLAARWLADGRYIKRGVLAGAAAVTVFFLFTPYALLRPERFTQGVITQWSYQYDGQMPSPATPLDNLRYYLRAAALALGPAGLLLAAAGSVRSTRDARRFLPTAVYPLSTLALMASPQTRFDRFLVPAMGPLALLAACGLVRVLASRPRWLAPFALAVAAWPLHTSLVYLRDVATPSTADRALDWVLAHAPERARILTSDPDLGLDRERFVPVFVPDPEHARLAIPQADFVIVAGQVDWDLTGLTPQLRAEPENARAGEPIAIYAVPEALRPPADPVGLSRATLRSSEGQAGIEALRDGDAETWWTSASAQQPGEWLQLEWPEPVRLSRLELGLGRRPQRASSSLHVLVSEDGRGWRRLAAVEGRPLSNEPSQVLVFEPVLTRWLRVKQMAEGSRRWGATELRLFGPAAEPGSSAERGR